MKHIPSFDEFVNEGITDSNLESINEANNLIYVKDKKFKSSQDIMDSFHKNAGAAFEKFVADKLGFKVKAVIESNRRGDSVVITTENISSKDIGIFANAFETVNIESWTGGAIEHQTVNNMQFEFSPLIFFQFHLNWRNLNGGSNGTALVFPGSSPHNPTVAYNIIENRFMDQKDLKPNNAKYWVSGGIS